MTIKEYLEKKDMSLTEFADLVGIKFNSMWLIMKGRRKPSRGLAYEIQIASDGEINAEELLGPPAIKHKCPCCGRRTAEKLKL